LGNFFKNFSKFDQSTEKKFNDKSFSYFTTLYKFNPSKFTKYFDNLTTDKKNSYSIGGVIFSSEKLKNIFMNKLKHAFLGVKYKYNLYSLALTRAEESKEGFTKKNILLNNQLYDTNIPNTNKNQYANDNFIVPFNDENIDIIKNMPKSLDFAIETNKFGCQKKIKESIEYLYCRNQFLSHNYIKDCESYFVVFKEALKSNTDLVQNKIINCVNNPEILEFTFHNVVMVINNTTIY